MSPAVQQLDRNEDGSFSVWSEPTASDVARDLAETKLGVALLTLLEQAGEVLKASDRKWADSVLAGRQRSFRMSPEALLAEQIINRLGPSDDCFVIREVAEGVVS